MLWQLSQAKAASRMCCYSFAVEPERPPAYTAQMTFQSHLQSEAARQRIRRSRKQIWRQVVLLHVPDQWLQASAHQEPAGGSAIPCRGRLSDRCASRYQMYGSGAVGSLPDDQQ